ncbi:MAG: nucleotidyltransferase family protein [Acidimicrobiia bacterium]
MTTISLGAACALGVPGSSAGAAFPTGPAWDAFLGRARDERAVSILACAVAGGLVDATEHQRAELAVGHEAAMRSCLYLEQATVNVAWVLDAAGIDVRLLKGPAVARLDYPDPSWRTFGDIDLLVRSADYDAAVAALVAGGGRRRSAEIRPGFDRRFGKGVCIVLPSGVQVDLHRTLASGPFGLTIPLDDLFAGDDTVRFGGAVIPVLCREHRLAHACVHAALGDASPRLVALRDIAQLLLTTDVDVAGTRAESVRWRASAVVAYAIDTAWRTLELEPTATSIWAREYSADRYERRSLAAYTGPDRSYARLMIAGLPAIKGVPAKVAYVRALLLPDAEYAARHDGGRVRRMGRALRARRSRERVA